MSQPQHTATIDIRRLAPAEQQAALLFAFRATGLNDAIEIVDEHDPKPLFYRLKAEMPGGFSWIYAQSGPDVWRVNVQKLARAHGAGECCGICSGS
jgi:uncharacterized protein (DUF2249 family)